MEELNVEPVEGTINQLITKTKITLIFELVFWGWNLVFKGG
jgi:hypothetical protein